MPGRLPGGNPVWLGEVLPEALVFSGVGNEGECVLLGTGFCYDEALGKANFCVGDPGDGDEVEDGGTSVFFEFWRGHQ